MNSSIRFPRIHAKTKASRAQRINTETKEKDGIVTLTTTNESYFCRNPGLARLVHPEITVPVIETSDDPQWQEYLQSRTDILNSLQSSFLAARSARDNYRNWLCKRIDEADADDDITTLVDEVEALNASDAGINTWGTRPQLDDLEYGIVAEERPLAVEGDTFNEGYTHLLEKAQGGPELVHVKEHRFNDKTTAQAFVNHIRSAFAKQGDHSKEVLTTAVDKDAKLPFVTTVLEADGNWEHRKALAEERNIHVSNACRRASEAENKQELLSIARVAKRYSRDMQVLNEGNTHDGGKAIAHPLARDIETRQVSMWGLEHNGRKCGIGFNYIRFATVMNAIADRAKNLKLDGFRRYPINEFETTRKPVDGDLLDVGCKQGEFLTLEIPDEHTPESLWMQHEKTWKPGREYAPSRLFIAPPPTTDVLAWQMGLNVAFAA